jgi:two-component system sensor histidine kinase KdpD
VGLAIRRASALRWSAAGARRGAAGLATALFSLAAASVAAWFLEGSLDVPNTSGVYLIPVIVMATFFGTTPAILTALSAFLIYDFLFTRPIYTFAIAETGAWVNLLLFLVVAVTIGRLAALQARRASEADRRAREAETLSSISSLLSASPRVLEGARAVLGRVATETGMGRMWISTDSAGGERIFADTGTGRPPSSSAQWVLQRGPGADRADWVRMHTGKLPASRSRPGDGVYRVNMATEGQVIGWLWGTGGLVGQTPGREQTRLLALSADQLALALRRSQLEEAATSAEIARQSDALKTALLTSVSHDLRTPLASIRVAAGSLADPDVTWAAADVRAVGATIDQSAQRLDRLVHGLLDLGRIQSGALRARLEPFDLAALVEENVERLRPNLGNRPLTRDFADDLPFVMLDGLLFDEVLTNLLENVARHAPAPAPAQVRARLVPGDRRILLTIEDGGPGVADTDLPRLFAPFERLGAGGDGARRGLGVGLAVVRGFSAAMGVEVTANRSPLGGLAVSLAIPADPGDEQ